MCDARSTKSNLSLVLELLRDMGYVAKAEKLKASEFGLPQRRTRYYIFAFRSGANFAVSADVLLEQIEPTIHACRKSYSLPAVVGPLSAENQICESGFLPATGPLRQPRS